MTINDRRSDIVFGFVVITVLLALLVLSLLALLALKMDPCSLIDTKPNFNIRELYPIASSDYRALAKFVGYMEFDRQPIESATGPNAGNKVYLPFQLTAVELHDDDTKNQTTLILSANCSTIRLNFSRSHNGLAAEEVFIKFPMLPPASLSGQSMCFIEDPSRVIKIAPDERYVCYEVRSYPCFEWDAENRFEKRLIGHYFIEHIAVEIDGDIERHRKGIFSKNLNYCPHLLGPNKTIRK